MDATTDTAAPRRTRATRTRPAAPGRAVVGLVTLLVLLGPRPARAQIGVLGGYSRDSLGEFDGGEDFRLADEAHGFHAGIFLDFGFGRFALRPAIVYRRLADAAFSGAEGTSADIEIVEFPLDLRVSAPLPVASPYLLAGPVVMFPSSARATIDQGLPGARVRLDIGLGLEWDLGFRLWPEVRYGHGLGGLASSETEAAVGRDASLDTFMLRLGVSF